MNNKYKKIDNYLHPKSIIKVFAENARTYKYFYDKGYYISAVKYLKPSDSTSNYLDHSNTVYFNFYLNQNAIYNISQKIVLLKNKIKNSAQKLALIKSNKLAFKKRFLKYALSSSAISKNWGLNVYKFVNRYLIKSEVQKDFYEMRTYSTLLFGRRIFNKNFRDLSEMTSLAVKGHLELRALNYVLCKIFGSLHPRKQKKFFVFINRYFKYIIKTYSSYVSGIGLQVNGRLFNKARASEYKASFGKFRRSAINCNLKVSKFEVKHQSLGTFGFKLTFIFADSPNPQNVKL